MWDGREDISQEPVQVEILNLHHVYSRLLLFTSPSQQQRLHRASFAPYTLLLNDLQRPVQKPKRRPLKMRCRLSSGAAVTLMALASSAFAGQPAKREYATHDYYVLEHNPSASASHHEVAATLGAEVVEQVGELRDHWLLRVPKPSSSVELDPVMDTYHSIRKRALYIPASQHLKREHLNARRLAKAVRSLERQVPKQRVKRWMNLDNPQIDGRADGDDGNNRLNHVMQALDIKDPEFHTQWHLLNLETPPNDMNVTGVWEMGYTGKGIIAAIVDDGLDFNSEDLAANYVGPRMSLRHSVTPY